MLTAGASEAAAAQAGRGFNQFELLRGKRTEDTQEHVHNPQLETIWRAAPAVTVTCLHCGTEEAALDRNYGTQLQRAESNQTAQMCGSSMEMPLVC